MLLITDEIYVAERVEFTGGMMEGIKVDGEVATTLL